VTSALFAIPGDLATLTGGYGYDRRVLGELTACGVAATHLPLPGGFPFPDADAVTQTLRLLAQAPADHVLLVDGLALGALPPAALAELAAPLVALVHHPLGLESGLAPATARALIENERAALAHVRHVIVTSPTTRDTLLADFGVAAQRIAVAEPGTDPAPRFQGSGAEALALLAIGSITPRKGHGVLVEALAELQHLPWTLTIIGSPDRDPACAAHLRAAIAAHGLGARVTLAGEESEAALGAAYAGADLFVLPSLYEGYGMVLGEAMARGLPIVTTTGGAAAQTVPDAAALKVPPGDAPALREALGAAIADASLRARLAEASWLAGQGLPRWREAAMVIAKVLHSIAGAAS
jgi:glycosyltransferase involved in cell wall biosynthesis